MFNHLARVFNKTSNRSGNVANKYSGDKRKYCQKYQTHDNTFCNHGVEQVEKIRFMRYRDKPERPQWCACKIGSVFIMGNRTRSIFGQEFAFKIWPAYHLVQVRKASRMCS